MIDSEFDETYSEKIDKKSIVIEILQNVFTDLTPDEITNIEADIDFIYDNVKKKKLFQTILKFSKLYHKFNSKINFSKLISKYLHHSILPGYKSTQLIIHSQIQNTTVSVLIKYGLSKAIILSIMLFI